MYSLRTRLKLMSFSIRSESRVVRAVGLTALVFIASMISPGLAHSQVSVGQGGTAAYSYPILVPPGVGGIAPNFSLSYSNGGVNGAVGTGWSIQGISMITRCSGRKAVDGISKPVDYGVDDKLCLDGQRLIQTDANGAVYGTQSGDSLGGNGQVREYRTERDMYARIRAYGAYGSNGANGPAYFKVWTKSGLVYEYGVNSNVSANAQIVAQGRSAAVANVVVAWAVSRVSDAAGNYMDFQYEQRDVSWGTSDANSAPVAGHEWNLIEVRYAGNGAQLPASRILFDYEDRPDNPGGAQDRAETYHKTAKNVNVHRLSGIRTYTNWPSGQRDATVPSGAVRVKGYTLSYDTGPYSGRSRLTKIRECASTDQRCLPAVKFEYSPGNDAVQFAPNMTFNQGPLANLVMQSTAGNYGILRGDFNGDGRVDIIRWSDNPAENRLFLSGATSGEFVEATQFNITDANLFKSDDCYTSLLTDIDGDGLPDIFRYTSATNLNGWACPGEPVFIYRNNGNGTFTRLNYSGPALDRKLSTTIKACTPNMQIKGLCSEDDETHDGWTKGANFFLIDVDGDGKLDIVTTLLPAYGKFDPVGDTCASTVCTRVYINKGDGRFEEVPSNLANHSVYVKPTRIAGLGSPRNVADINGDGRADLTALATIYFNPFSAYKSRGDGNFDGVAGTGQCESPIDFNGDGRQDCLNAGVVGSYVNSLAVADGSSSFQNVGNFNLKNPGQELTGPDRGFQVADFDGDGRADILRWHDDPSQNILYLSNGDGTFRATQIQLQGAYVIALPLSSQQIQKSDGSSVSVIDDFSGRGVVEYLRMNSAPYSGSVPTRNVLYSKTSTAPPPDTLIRVTSGSGLKTDLTWVPLTDANAPNGLGARYMSDRATANAASYPMFDLVSPIYVVATVTADTGVSTSRNVTEYSYRGLKASFVDGIIGFREMRTQQAAADGSPMSVVTRSLQKPPYIGMVSTTETWLASMNDSNPQILSQTSNVYCDTTSAVDPSTATDTSPCTTAAKVQRPYLYKTVEQGRDLAGAVLPTVTTTSIYNSDGDAITIVTDTNGTALGQTLASRKVVSNICCRQNNITGDNWILGRIERTTVTNTVANVLPSLAVSAGSAPNSAAVAGVNPPGTGIAPKPISPAVLSAILGLLDD